MTRRDVTHAGLALGAVGLVTLIYVTGLHVSNSTIIALSYLLVVLIAAASSRLWVAVLTSLAATLCFNFFFLPPVGTLNIADPQNWIVLLVFVSVSLIASRLSSVALARARDAMARRDELARLFDLSRDVLWTTDSREAVAQLAQFVSRHFELPYVGLCLPHGSEWDIVQAGTETIPLEPAMLDAVRREGQRTLVLSGTTVRAVPLGTQPVGLLVTAGRDVESGTLDAIAGVAAIAIERAQFLEARKAAELARQSEQLKSALLASLGHDLRTPLTTIRLAAVNLQASWLTEDERREQSDLVLAEVERLQRLFQNILEMARIDAGAVATALEWVDPSEIVEAARAQVDHTLRSHPLDVVSDVGRLVQVDPRLTAAALSHLLENAAQYTSPGTPITVHATVSDAGLTVTVRDRGTGIATQDLPHLFERFYRGGLAADHASGTGMGLAIARGLLAAEGGRLSADNDPDGGAVFTISVPAATRQLEPAEAHA